MRNETKTNKYLYVSNTVCLLYKIEDRQEIVMRVIMLTCAKKNNNRTKKRGKTIKLYQHTHAGVGKSKLQSLFYFQRA